MNYINVLYVQILNWKKKNIARVTSEPKNPIYKQDLGKTSYNGLLFTRGEFLWLVGAKKVSLRIILTYYMFK